MDFDHKIIDAIPALAWCAQPGGAKEFLNRQWRGYTGLSVEEGLGCRPRCGPLPGHVREGRNPIAPLPALRPGVDLARRRTNLIDRVGCQGRQRALRHRIGGDAWLTTTGGLRQD